eukprot:5347646-Alexandrium_andersonii.AAC.1
MSCVPSSPPAALALSCVPSNTNAGARSRPQSPRLPERAHGGGRAASACSAPRPWRKLPPTSAAPSPLR